MNRITRASDSPAAAARLQKPSSRTVSILPSRPALASQEASLAISASVMTPIIVATEGKANAQTFPRKRGPPVRSKTIAPPEGQILAAALSIRVQYARRTPPADMLIIPPPEFKQGQQGVFHVASHQR